ncbi:hypothetical protein F511_47468 [Dorcoceras hygrometricum]|uniref:Uncharacterized protein n=1 Tax=Dorcoceras hygrometricum TaxID=472368 RepID=A0A2Z6ZQY1_9LAMI|nr:hypothetical protein F511_47468 [Dorcoceras hygrometricum]
MPQQTDLSSSNAYVSHTTTTHAADVTRSMNRFSPNKLKPAMLTSSTLSNHAMLTSSNPLTDFTERSLKPAMFTSASQRIPTTLTSSNLLLDFTKISKISNFPEML